MSAILPIEITYCSAASSINVLGGYWSIGMRNILSFNTSETSAIDTDPIQTLKRELGEKRCRAVVDGMIFEITDLLCKIERLVSRSEFDEVEDALDQVTQISGDLGLVCLTDVASDLRECVSRGDQVATMAVSARLIRLGEDSLFSLIEFTNKSIV